jgi:hypothetical protein
MKVQRMAGPFKIFGPFFVHVLNTTGLHRTALADSR